MSNNKTSEKKGFLDVFMAAVEKVCDLLPPPTILFCILFLIVAVIGAILNVTGVELLNPALCLRETLTSRIERMAIGAGIDLDFL